MWFYLRMKVHVSKRVILEEKVLVAIVAVRWDLRRHSGTSSFCPSRQLITRDLTPLLTAVQQMQLIG